MKLTSSGISAWGMTLYAALLPFHAFGRLPARRWTLVEPCELVLLAVAPALLLELLRARRLLLGSWIARGVALIALVGIVAELLSARVSRLALLEEALALLAVGGVASVVLGGRAPRLMTGVLVGGSFAIGIGAVGYGLALSTGGASLQGFVFASDHPIFPGWPRMTGTLGRHAVWLGEYCVMLLAVALAADERVGSRRLRIGARIAAAAGLLASLSFAWLGGLVLALRSFRVWRPNSGASGPGRSSVPTLALLVVYAVVTFWMLVGAPVDPRVHQSPRRCRELDGAHHVLRRGPERGVCQPVLSTEPYPHRVTLYALAHDTAWRRFEQHPVLGAGRSGYGAFARAHAARVHALGPIGYYQQPVGLVASTLAYTGLAGAGALVVLLYGIWRARPSPAPAERGRQWLFYGALGLLLCGTQTDFELRGPLWVLLGLLVGLSGRQPEIATSKRDD